MKPVWLLFLISSLSLSAQDNNLSVLAYRGRDVNKPLLFYISGDGGLGNSFSSALLKQLYQQGYSVLGMNSRTYFWSKKTPEQAAKDVGMVLDHYLGAWKCKSFVMIGYSFGADVAPFIQRRLPPNLSGLAKRIVLMSPSPKTDFEIHILTMIGLGSSRGVSVADEINRLTRPATLIFGTNENEFPLDSIRTKNVQTIKLPGGHHYNRDVNTVARAIVNSING